METTNEYAQCGTDYPNGENRFDVIKRAKSAILEETNIARSEDEMKVLDNILFRAWQMGWLRKYEYFDKIQHPLDVETSIRERAKKLSDTLPVNEPKGLVYDAYVFGAHDQTKILTNNACEWLEKFIEKNFNTFIDNDTMDEFKQAMKGETNE